MSSFSYMLAALFAMLPAPFLFQGKMSVPLRGAFIAIVLLGFELFSLLASSESYPFYELLPFQMLALCLCVSTLFLKERKTFFAALANASWLWADFFGMLSLSYRNVPFHLFPILFLCVGFLPIFILNLNKREGRFVLVAFWAAAWIMSFAYVPE